MRKIILQYTFLQKSLPTNVNILSFERWRDEDNSFLLRMEHILEHNEDAELSKSVQINLNVSYLLYTLSIHTVFKFKYQKYVSTAKVYN